MAKFRFDSDKKTAVLAVKRALNGKLAILKDKNGCLTVGTPPFMTVEIQFSDGFVETKASLFGKILVGTVDSAIELLDGFEQA